MRTDRCFQLLEDMNSFLHFPSFKFKLNKSKSCSIKKRYLICGFAETFNLAMWLYDKLPVRSVWSQPSMTQVNLKVLWRYGSRPTRLSSLDSSRVVIKTRRDSSIVVTSCLGSRSVSCESKVRFKMELECLRVCVCVCVFLQMFTCFVLFFTTVFYYRELSILQILDTHKHNTTHTEHPFCRHFHR